MGTGKPHGKLDRQAERADLVFPALRRRFTLYTDMLLEFLKFLTNPLFSLVLLVSLCFQLLAFVPVALSLPTGHLLFACAFYPLRANT